MTLALLLVALAAALDIAANVMLAKSCGFKKRLWGVIALLLVGLAFFCLSWLSAPCRSPLPTPPGEP